MESGFDRDLARQEVGLAMRVRIGLRFRFLRKQLTFYQERKITPRRADNPNRLSWCCSAAGLIGETR